MKPLTPKKRAQIYQRVAIRLCSNRYLSNIDILLCNQLKEKAKLDHYQYVIGLFPEFALFEKLEQPNDLRTGWWKEGEREPRIMCMLLCYEMTKDSA